MSNFNRIFLNSSHQLYNLGFSETLMLRNFARLKGMKFSYMIGGSESIRDIQEGRSLDSDGFEFSFIESLFAFEKIFYALERVFSDDINRLLDIYILVNVSTPDGIELISSLESFDLPSFIRSSNIIYNFDRRNLYKSFNMNDNNRIKFTSSKDKFSTLIISNIELLRKLNYSSSISGIYKSLELREFYNCDLLPDFFKTPLFTFFIAKMSQDFILKELKYYNHLESKLFGLIRNSLYHKYSSLNESQTDLIS